METTLIEQELEICGVEHFTHEEVKPFKQIIYNALHRDLYAAILDENGNPFEDMEELLLSSPQTNAQLTNVLLHRLNELWMYYEQAIKLINNEKIGYNIAESKYNPINNSKNVLDKPSNAIALNYNTMSVYAQRIPVVDVL
jgi:hypothetical protein